MVRTNNRSAVEELVDNVGNKNRGIQSDCIKVLYEIGERKPGLIVGFAEEFASLLDSPNPRLIWGAMTALNTIAAEDPERVFDLLPKILSGAESGSVIARDHAIGILVKLGSIERYAPRCFPLLLKQLKTCPNNQLPMYAEMSAKIINDRNKEAFNRVVEARGRRLAEESPRKRVARVLKKVMT